MATFRPFSAHLQVLPSAKRANMLATLEQIFLPHKSEGIGIGTGTTLFGSFALNLFLLSPMRKLRVSIELEPSH